MIKTRKHEKRPASPKPTIHWALVPDAIAWRRSKLPEASARRELPTSCSLVRVKRRPRAEAAELEVEDWQWVRKLFYRNALRYLHALFGNAVQRAS